MVEQAGEERVIFLSVLFLSFQTLERDQDSARSPVALLGSENVIHGHLFPVSMFISVSGAAAQVLPPSSQQWWS